MLIKRIYIAICFSTLINSLRSEEPPVSINPSNLTESIEQSSLNDWTGATTSYELGRYYESINDANSSNYYYAGAYKKCIEGIKKSAVMGFGEGLEAFTLGEMYRYGRGVKPNPETAIAWYVFSIKHGGSVDTIKTCACLDFDRDIKPKITPTVIRILNSFESAYITAPIATGTAFYVDSSGYLITAYHVIEGANKIKITENDHSNYNGDFILGNKELDYAILKLRKSECPGTKKCVSIFIDSFNCVKLGDKVYTLGYPLTQFQGKNLKYTSGEINSEAGTNDNPAYWQISAQIQPGSSGGPLFDERGYAIGITVATLSAKVMLKTGAIPQNVNYALKLKYLTNDLQKLGIQTFDQPTLDKRPDEVLKKENLKAVVLVTIY